MKPVPFSPYSVDFWLDNTALYVTSTKGNEFIQKMFTLNSDLTNNKLPPSQHAQIWKKASPSLVWT